MPRAPIVLFIYNRPEHTRQTLEALAANTLAQESDLFIYADGPKENAMEEQLERIRQVRDIARSRQWCRTVTMIESGTNRGLSASVISGVTETVGKYGRVIVLEDDIVTGKYFLEYMNTALEKYESDKQVWEVTGFRPPVKTDKSDSAFFSKTEYCWGWATWADRWRHFKKDAAYYKTTFTKRMIWEFNMEGADPGCWKQIEANLSGKMNTWAVFWAATIFINKGFVLTPYKSLTRNIGLDNTGTNCDSSFWFRITNSVDCPIVFFPDKTTINKEEFDKDKRYFKRVTNAGRSPLWLVKETVKKLTSEITKPFRCFSALYRKSQFIFDSPMAFFIALVTNPFFFERYGLFKNIKYYAKKMDGRLLDFGCGSKPYKLFFKSCSEYIGCDIKESGHNHYNEKIDVFYDGNTLPFDACSFDCILSSEVFEHVPNLEAIIKELNRILRINGSMLITVPFVWNEHEVPYDFVRYTSFGITDLLRRNGFEIVELRKSMLYIETLFQMLAEYMRYTFSRIPFRSIQLFLQLILIFPVILLGIIISTIFPKNDSLYGNLIVFARKTSDSQ